MNTRRYPLSFPRLCGYFGKKYLREVPEEEFYLGISGARKFAGDRAVLRAMHIYDENRRVDAETAALEPAGLTNFCALSTDRGHPHGRFFRTSRPPAALRHQELAVAPALCGRLLNGRGRAVCMEEALVGTIQAFVRTICLKTSRQVSRVRPGAGRRHISSSAAPAARGSAFHT